MRVLERPFWSNPDGLHWVANYEYATIDPMPDACIILEKTWTIYNTDFFNPQQGCVDVPNIPCATSR